MRLQWAMEVRLRPRLGLSERGRGDGYGLGNDVESLGL